VEGLITAHTEVSEGKVQYPKVWVENERVGFSLYRHGGHPPTLRIGSTHRILCSPQCSGDALLDTWNEKWGGVLGLVLLGAALLGGGFVAMANLTLRLADV